MPRKTINLKKDLNGSSGYFDSKYDKYRSSFKTTISNNFLTAQFTICIIFFWTLWFIGSFIYHK